MDPNNPFNPFAGAGGGIPPGHIFGGTPGPPQQMGMSGMGGMGGMGMVGGMNGMGGMPMMGMTGSMGAPMGMAPNMPMGGQMTPMMQHPQHMMPGHMTMSASAPGPAVKQIKKHGKKKKKKKKKKYPGQPTRPPSAYLMYANDFRAQVRAAHPDISVGNLSKVLGAQWKELSETVKQPYLNKQDEALRAFKIAKTQWDATHVVERESDDSVTEENDEAVGAVYNAYGDDEEGRYGYYDGGTAARMRQIADDDKKKKKKKKKKDPAAPKRPMSAFLMWRHEAGRTTTAREENPGMSVGEISKMLGQVWANMGDDEKAKYQERSQTQMAAWRIAVDAYKASGGGQDL